MLAMFSAQLCLGHTRGQAFLKLIPYNHKRRPDFKMSPLSLPGAWRAWNLRNFLLEFSPLQFAHSGAMAIVTLHLVYLRRRKSDRRSELRHFLPACVLATKMKNHKWASLVDLSVDFRHQQYFFRIVHASMWIDLKQTLVYTV